MLLRALPAEADAAAGVVALARGDPAAAAAPAPAGTRPHDAPFHPRLIPRARCRAIAAGARPARFRAGEREGDRR
jgi:hypothetical protein